jgi:peroxiredoxin
MALMETPICEFGLPAIDFSLPDPSGRLWTLADCRGENGTLVMFICNHCPYVKAIQSRLVRDSSELLSMGIKSVAIMPNDSVAYPEDSAENMRTVAEQFHYPFPYLIDETQATAHAYGAVCTPDFFGYNRELQLQYRGRLDSAGKGTPGPDTVRELVNAMTEIARTGHGPGTQYPSAGCSIKWRRT